MNTPLISVICPVYKAEKYLHRCINSILAQTFTDWELLLIDDGSPDNSGTICDEYAAKDSRVRVFHNQNGGVSSARQCGMDHAQGEYIIHADPDDWVEPNMLEELYVQAQKENADMVICDFIDEYRHETKYSKQKIESLNSRDVLCSLLFQQLHGSCWNKLVRRACYNEYGIKFPEGVNLWEDLWVSCLLCSHDIRIVYLNKAYYHYDRMSNPNSIVRIKDNKKKVEDKISFCRFFSHYFVNDSELYEGLFGSKLSAKISMFCSTLYSAQDIKSTFPEINEVVVKKYGTKMNLRNISPFCVSLIIRSKYLCVLARILHVLGESWINPFILHLKNTIKLLYHK